jgi:NodT family efflux transporter outer membrane factor (OMF) lipoprotein
MAATLAGCAVGPDFHRPAAPAGADYGVPLAGPTASADVPGGDAQRFVAGGDVSFRWWESFGSPQLNALVEEALRANPTIPAAQAALRQAKETVYAQQGYFFPTVAAGYSVERQKLAGNLSGSSAPGVQGNGTAIAATQSATPPYNEPLYFNFHTAQLTVGYTPDVLGGNRRKVESLQAQADLQRFALEATYTSLASNVVAAAIQAASLRAQVAASHAIIDANRRALQVLEAKSAQGFATRIDVAAQESQLAGAEALLPPLETQLATTQDLLRTLLGRFPNQPAGESLDLAALTLPRDLPVSVPSRLIEQRPDIRAAEEQLHAANAGVGVAVAAMLPQFSISGAIGGTATGFSQMFRHGGPFWNLIGDVSQPVFTGGTLLHQKRAADQALVQAAAQYQGTVLAAYQNVADTLHVMQGDAAALAAMRKAERAAHLTLDLTQERLQQGYGDTLANLAAESAWQQALLNLVQAEATRFGDTAALYVALGGGWWNR